VFVATVWVAPFAVYFFKCDIYEIIKNFILGTSPNQLWFLLMLFCLFVIFYPLSGFFARKNILGAVAVLIIYGIGIIGSSFIPNVFQVFRACAYLPMFWMGFKIRQYGSVFLRKIPVIVWIAVDIALFIIVQYIGDFDGALFTLLKLGFEFLLHIIGAIMSFIILQKLADRIDWKNSLLFGRLSKNSMTVYLFHQQIIYLLIYWLNGRLNPYVHAAVNFFGALLISLLISFVLMKTKWTRMLVGEK
jgi:hypothetical protein